MNTTVVSDSKEIAEDWFSRIHSQPEFCSALRRSPFVCEPNPQLHEVLIECQTMLQMIGMQEQPARALLLLVAEVDENNTEIEFVCALGRAKNKLEKPAFF